MWNFNPRAPCGARPGSEQAPGFENCISIHAPRAGRDHLEGNRPEGWTISIHAPRAGRDKLTGLVQGSNIIFQSTRPVRGATPIFPRCGVDRLISIHAPRAGRDAMFGNMQTESTLFQSTRPVRGATRSGALPPGFLAISIHAPRAGRDGGGIRPEGGVLAISIHAPRAGRDTSTSISAPASEDFNPRAPCGARHRSRSTPRHAEGFQSTRPVRGATARASFSSAMCVFQSTRPVRGATPRPAMSADFSAFQSTRPVRGATLAKMSKWRMAEISIHAPRAGRDTTINLSF